MDDQIELNERPPDDGGRRPQSSLSTTPALPPPPSPSGTTMSERWRKAKRQWNRKVSFVLSEGSSLVNRAPASAATVLANVTGGPPASALASAASRTANRTVYFNMRPPKDHFDKKGNYKFRFDGNEVHTTKYTLWSFVPKNLAEQFRRLANFYFLALVIIQMFPEFEVASPFYAALPIVLIVMITALKDAVEDWRRRISDREINRTKCLVLRNIKNTNHAYKRSLKTRMQLRVRLYKKRLARAWRWVVAWVRRVFGWQAPMPAAVELRTMPRRSRTTSTANTRLQRQSSNDARPPPHSTDTEDNEEVDEEDLATETEPESETEETPAIDPATSTSPASIRMDLAGFRTKHKQKRLPQWSKKKWRDLRVGDIVKLVNNDSIPADMVILSTSEPDSLCYVETKNLDGETNLKIKQGLNATSSYKLPGDFVNLRCWFEAEPPNNNMFQFNGNVNVVTEVFDDDQRANDQPEHGPALLGKVKTTPVSLNEVLLRGCTLRNTQWVIGVVVFAGRDTKQMLNSGDTPSKQSHIEKLMNPHVFINLIAVLVLCIIIALVSRGFLGYTLPLNPQYLGSTYLPPDEQQSITAQSTFIFFASLILLQNFVPISLYVTTEFVKTIQAYFIYSDLDMYYEPYDAVCVPKTWSIADDLGQIEYLFSDKTGTLTRNCMEFRKCSVGGVTYGGYHDTHGGADTARDKMMASLAQHYPNPHSSKDGLTFVDENFVRDLYPTVETEDAAKRRSMIKEFFTHLALCHTVLPDYSESETIMYQSQSPDEAALVSTARDLGFAFIDRTNNEVAVDILGLETRFRLLNIIEFTSARKRMSVIFRSPSGEIILYIKGADSVIFERLAPGQEEMLSQTTDHLNQFANEGLRTLCLAYRVIPEREYAKWADDYSAALSSLTDRDQAVEKSCKAIERDLILLGATAIEDRLQEWVPECISNLRRGGIKIWMCTGDKTETAINIGFSCNLLSTDMLLVVIKGGDKQSTVQQIVDAMRKCFAIDVSDLSVFRSTTDPDEITERLLARQVPHSEPLPEKVGLIIDGHSLKHALEKDVRMAFLQVAIRCRSVICCRVSPLQKAQVVALVKRTLGVMTLAIGDGANDVSMIQEANVGVGIQGLEGMQAVLASDYVISQFAYLNKLLLVHGRWSYARTAKMTLIMFYKNMAWTNVLFWYQIYCGWSAFILYDYFLVLFYSLIYTGLPPIVIGVFDQDISCKQALATPEAYAEGIKQNLYTTRQFLLNILDGVYQSVMCFFVAYLLVGETPIFASGYGADLITLGLVSATSAIIIVNLSMGMDTYHWTWLVHFAVWGSIVAYFLTVLVLSALPDSSLQGAFVIMTSGAFLMSIPVSIVVGILPRYLIRYYNMYYRPSDVEILREVARVGGDVSVAAPSTSDNGDVTLLDDQALQQSAAVQSSAERQSTNILQAFMTPVGQVAQRVNAQLDKIIAEPIRKGVRRTSSVLLMRTGSREPNRGYAFSQEPGMASHLANLTSPAAQSMRRRSRQASWSAQNLQRMTSSDASLPRAVTEQQPRRRNRLGSASQPILSRAANSNSSELGRHAKIDGEGDELVVTEVEALGDEQGPRLPPSYEDPPSPA